MSNVFICIPNFLKKYIDKILNSIKLFSIVFTLKNISVNSMLNIEQSLNKI